MEIMFVLTHPMCFAFSLFNSCQSTCSLRVTSTNRKLIKRTDPSFYEELSVFMTETHKGSTTTAIVPVVPYVIHMSTVRGKSTALFTTRSWDLNPNPSLRL